MLFRITSWGGGGDDFAYVGAQEVFRGGEGNDVGLTVGFIFFTNVTGRLAGPVYMDGEEGDDQLNGTLSDDVLKGGDGSDILRGENMPAGWTARLADDNTFLNWIEVQQPQELFSPEGGADVLDGGNGEDLLVGDGGNDILSGGSGNDRIYGDDETGYRVEPGDDFLDGGEGDDLLSGGAGADSLSGGAGVDGLYGDMGNDILDGGGDADTLFGGDGADELYGGASDDLLVGDGLNNQSDSGTAGADDFLDGGEGNDVLEGGIGADTLFGGAGNDRLFGQDDDDSLFGDEGDDELQGMAGNDLLSGDTGHDRLFSQDGADTLYGDEGNDTLSGGEGKRGTGYLFGVLRGRPRGRSVESRPAVSANWACHSGDPKGDWRFRQVRSRVSSCSKRGSSIHRSHSVGSGTGGGSTNVGCLRLDHGHCVADSTSCARTGLRST